MEEITEFNDFLSASGRYLIVSKKTSKRVVTELKKMARKETYCVESVPQTHTQNHCHAVWETVPNPKFDPTFSCNDMAAFDSCIDKNKEKFVRSYRVYKGNKCASYSYTINMCKAFETRQWTSIHPITEDRSYTDLIVYRFEKDNFYKIGDDETPIRQEGLALEHKSFESRGDYLYVATTRGLQGAYWRRSFDTEMTTTKVAAYLIKNGLFTKAGEVRGIGKGKYVSAVLFRDDSLFLEMRPVHYYYNYYLHRSNSTVLVAIDLSKPQAPTLVGELTSSGTSQQLVAVSDHLVGIGQTSTSILPGYARTVLYDASNLKALTEVSKVEYATDMKSSYNGVGTNDQVYHLDYENGRLIMPIWASGPVPNEYEGFVCSDSLWISQYRLTLTAIDAGGLVKEAELHTNQRVERSLALDEASILAFADAGIYHATKVGQDWQLGVVKEDFITQGLYVDPSLPEGKIAAIQVFRDGSRLKRMRIALGSREQIEENRPEKTVEIPANMIACLGNPQRISFHDDMVLVGFRQNIVKGNEQLKANIDYRGNLAWKITADGFVQQPDDVANALAEEKRKSCYIRDGVPQDASKEVLEEIIGSLSAKDLECWGQGDRVNFHGVNKIL